MISPPSPLPLVSVVKNAPSFTIKLPVSILILPPSPAAPLRTSAIIPPGERSTSANSGSLTLLLTSIESDVLMNISPALPELPVLLDTIAPSTILRRSPSIFIEPEFPKPVLLLIIPPNPEMIISGDLTVILPPLPVASLSTLANKPLLPSEPFKVKLMGLEIISSLFVASTIRLPAFPELSESVDTIESLRKKLLLVIAILPPLPKEFDSKILFISLLSRILVFPVLLIIISPDTAFSLPALFSIPASKSLLFKEKFRASTKILPSPPSITSIRDLFVKETSARFTFVGKSKDCKSFKLTVPGESKPPN